MVFTRQSTKGAVERLGNERLIAYFCAEFGITDALPIYSGGLGVLAGDIVQEAAVLNLPFVGVGLFYRRGYFHQHIDAYGQVEVTQDINPLEVPLELMTDADGETILIEVPVHERTVFAQVWRFRVGSVNLYLLDTDHWKNSPEDRQITDQLYGGDQHKRIQQELVLGVGGLRMLEAIGIKPSLYHMNEGHSGFLALELIARGLAAGKDMDAAKAHAKARTVFTNHTIVAAGNDLFPHELVRYYLGTYAHQSGVGIDTILELGACDQPEKLAMTQLAMRVAAKTNAVSKLHGKKAKELWPNYKFESVTNGVHLPAWMAPEIQQLFSEADPTWYQHINSPVNWKRLRSLQPKSLWQTHLMLKGRLLDEVYARTGIQLDLDTLTIVWARRFATYKRPDLLFRDLERLKTILFNEDRPVQIIIAGKSHPADEQAKEIIAHLSYLFNYKLKHRAVLVDDYSITLSRLLVSGADVWLNTPVFGQEASGTSGMKASSNGALQCTIPDGWAWEVDWGGLGFKIPPAGGEQDLYRIIEQQIVPTFYRRNSQDIPELWLHMMQETIAELAPQFSSERMVLEYIAKMYLPVLDQQV